MGNTTDTETATCHNVHAFAVLGMSEKCSKNSPMHVAYHIYSGIYCEACVPIHGVILRMDGL